MRSIIPRLGVLGLLVAASVMAQPPPSPPVFQPSREAQAAATAALKTLGDLVNGNNFQAMGFESEGEAKTVTLGQPLTDQFIRLDQLRAFQGGDVASLLVPGKTVLRTITT